MPEALAPVDTSVTVPDVVKRAAAAAEAAHKAAYTAEPTPAPADTPPTEDPPAATEPAEPAAVAAPQPAPQPAPTPAVAPAEPAPEDWKSRYNSMKGRFDQSQRMIGSMQEQMSQLGSELVRTQALLRGPDMQQPQPSQSHLTEEDVQTYGPDLLEVTKRAALEAVDPQIRQVQEENQRLRKRLDDEGRQRTVAAIAAEVPNWQAINNSERFRLWCSLPDLYSGVVRKVLLNDAVRTANAPRAISFFRGFLAEEVATGHVQAPQPLQPAPEPGRTAAVPLEALTAPGRAKPATGATGVPADKPIITHAQIAKFYADVRRNVYAGRLAEKDADEAIIFAAQREGRVR
jgi:hypothetical protein